jgi:hypothetical protein
VQLLPGNRDAVGRGGFDNAHSEYSQDDGGSLPPVKPAVSNCGAGGRFVLLRLEKTARFAIHAVAGGGLRRTGAGLRLWRRERWRWWRERWRRWGRRRLDAGDLDRYRDRDIGIAAAHDNLLAYGGLINL